jgi:hypothetical protein
MQIEDTGATRIYGNLVPTVNAIQQIGTSNMHFKEAWIDTLHISPNTLYIGDAPVIGTDQNDSIVISADQDQSVTVKTTGLGITNVTSAQGVNIAASGMNSIVDIKSTGTGGIVTMNAATEINMNAPSTTIGSNLTVQGDLTVNGTQFIANVQTVNVQDPVILVNAGEAGTGVTKSGGYAGMRVDRGDAVDHQLVFNETNDKFEIGPIGGESPIATETYVDTKGISTSNFVSGTLGTERGGTGTMTYTGYGAVVLNSNASLANCTMSNAIVQGNSVTSNMDVIGGTWGYANSVHAGLNKPFDSLLSSYNTAAATPYPEHGMLCVAAGRQLISFMDDKQSVMDTTVGSSALNSFRITEGYWGTYNAKTGDGGFTIDVGKSIINSDSNIGYPLYLNEARKGDVLVGSNLKVEYRIDTTSVSARGVNLTSDDRLKDNEIYITNATDIINRLRPQMYDKWSSMDFRENSNASFVKETGLIAQEMFYDTPELRHLVTLPADANSNALYTTPIQSSTDPSIDPIYTEWGTSMAAIDYIGLVPYLVKCIQEKDALLVEMESRVAVLEQTRASK